MDDNASGVPEPERPDPGPTMLITIGVFCLALACLGIGFYAGRATAPKSSAKAAGCSTVQATLDRLLQQQKAAPTDDPQNSASELLLTASNVVLQNPNCFDTETRATAQTAKDQAASNQNSAAVSGAADRIAKCIGLVDVGFGCPP
ncbi:hypothetical protein [Streptomyces sp. NPDC093060]|uniref:hypothetical protein n=1 Tax=Streptomyces sp. NPDC093060 TaxID=3366019 RepID=UPI003806A765